MFHIRRSRSPSDAGEPGRVHELLNGQVPPAQAEGVGQLPEAHDGSDDDSAEAEKVENCLSSFRPPHFGHALGRSEDVVTSFSNAWPQFEHWYS